MNSAPEQRDVAVPRERGWARGLATPPSQATPPTAMSLWPGVTDSKRAPAQRPRLTNT